MAAAFFWQNDDWYHSIGTTVLKRVQLPVRDFALPIPRSGSIEVHSGYGYLPQQGDEAHRLIQQQRGAANPKYKTEQKVSHSFEHAGYVFNVSGRIDGLIDGAPPYLEEIKTAFDAKTLFEKLRDNPDHPYCLQLKTYAYIYSLQNGTVPACGLLIGSYANDARFELPMLLDIAAYERWLELRLEELVAEARQREEERERRKAVGASLQFPFEQPRAGQLDLIGTIERTIATGDALMVQAPTGMGKTAGVIFPMLRDAMQRGQKLVTLHPKTASIR